MDEDVLVLMPFGVKVGRECAIGCHALAGRLVFIAIMVRSVNISDRIYTGSPNKTQPLGDLSISCCYSRREMGNF